MRHQVRLKEAFSMVELIFVIIVLGIVASIGSAIIFNVYGGYISNKAQYNSSIKTELTLNQIANRLHYAIPSTIGYRQSKGGGFTLIAAGSNIPSTATVFQWVGYDGDSFEAIDSGTASGSQRRPGWSGFCDVDAYVKGSKTLPTPGSHLELANTIIGNLSKDAGGSNAKSLADTHIYFPDGSDYNVSSGNGENIVLDNPIPIGKDIYERYKLAWSSYALSVENGDLYLYYDFAPTSGASLSGAKKSLLLKDIDNFRFKASEGAIRIKICKKEYIDSNTTADAARSCKEKVIF